MRFKAKKTYGEYKEVPCPFCGKRATHKNSQDIEVCPQHTQSLMEEIRCICGSWLEQRSGKFGPYFNCLKCGNINFNKAMEIKEMQQQIQQKIQSKTPPSQLTSPPNINPSSKSLPQRTIPTEKKISREITIRSDDPRYFD